jgi:hypothetical protein
MEYYIPKCKSASLMLLHGYIIFHFVVVYLLVTIQCTFLPVMRKEVFCPLQPHQQCFIKGFGVGVVCVCYWGLNSGPTSSNVFKTTTTKKSCIYFLDFPLLVLRCFISNQTTEMIKALFPLATLCQMHM